MLLAINTATPHLAMALVEDGVLLAEASQDVGAEHSEAIFVLLEDLFRWTRRPRSDLKAIGVAVGPGGFTGLRTGLSVAKSMAQVLGLPAYGVGTLEALAFQFPGPALVSAMLDARRGLVFAGLYRIEGDRLVTVKEGALHPLTTWLEYLETQAGPITLVGEGAMRHRAVLEAHGGEWHVPADALMATRAVTVGLLAEQKRRAGLPSETEAIAPLYLREPQAVVNWEAAQAEARDAHAQS